jgi:hypothetical protein
MTTQQIQLANRLRAAGVRCAEIAVQLGTRCEVLMRHIGRKPRTRESFEVRTARELLAEASTEAERRIVLANFGDILAAVTKPELTP